MCYIHIHHDRVRFNDCPCLVVCGWASTSTGSSQHKIAINVLVRSLHFPGVQDLLFTYEFTNCH
jgi:hypothetical protein